jgi:hypothetical protein
MGRWGHGRVIAALLLTLVAGLGYAGTARADVEPNNVISYAEGPINGSVYIGNISTPDDVDFYVLYMNSQQQIHLDSDILSTGKTSDCLDIELLDTNGRALTSDYTTPVGVNRFFIRVSPDDWYSDCAPFQYRFQITPAAAFTTGLALDKTLIPTLEPNETPGQAVGPLGANINYVGAKETENDEDWFFFWVPSGTHQVEISTTAPASSCGSYIRLYTDSLDSSADSAYAGQSSFSRISQTLTGPAKYYISATTDDCALGQRWQLRIESQTGISMVDPTPPPPPPTPPEETQPEVFQSKFPSSISLRRSGARYSGRVNSSFGSCKGNRRVVLRRAGSGSKSFGSTRTRANGTFTIKRRSRLRGRIYVVVAGRSSAETLCRSANSRRIRG